MAPGVRHVFGAACESQRPIWHVRAVAARGVAASGRNPHITLGAERPIEPFVVNQGRAACRAGSIFQKSIDSEIVDVNDAFVGTFFNHSHSACTKEAMIA